MKTKERLVKALLEAGAPEAMITLAERGHYDDFETTIETPIVRLVTHCKQNGLDDLATRAMNGEFDASKEEGEAWFKENGSKIFEPLRDKLKDEEAF